MEAKRPIQAYFSTTPDANRNHYPTKTNREPMTIVSSCVMVLTTAAAVELQAPLEWQVIQRDASNSGDVEIVGTAPPETRLIEARASLRTASQGSAMDWTPIAMGEQVDGGQFTGHLRLPAGGWYTLAVRFRRSHEDLAVLETAIVDHVGVGDIFVVAGQSNSSNHGSERQKTATGLVTTFDGTQWRLANDPQPGGSGDGGSFMPAFGDVVAKRLQIPVGIVACGIGATSVREWLPEGSSFPNPPTLEGRVRKRSDGRWESDEKAFAMLTARMKPFGKNGFRAVLWHQGESDANQADPARSLTGSQYRAYLEKLIKESRREIGWEAPWLVALVSSHGNDEVPEIRAAQRSLWEDGIAVEGPDSDALTGALRDGVHFNGKGLRAHGQLWAERVCTWLEASQTPAGSDEKQVEP